MWSHVWPISLLFPQWCCHPVAINYVKPCMTSSLTWPHKDVSLAMVIIDSSSGTSWHIFRLQFSVAMTPWWSATMYHAITSPESCRCLFTGQLKLNAFGKELKLANEWKGTGGMIAVRRLPDYPITAQHSWSSRPPGTLNTLPLRECRDHNRENHGYNLTTDWQHKHYHI